MTDRAGPRVLVAEDEVVIAMLLEAELDEHGFAVVGPFGTVLEALKAAETEVFDIAVLDANLRGERIKPVVMSIKARGIPIVMFSGYATLSREPELADLPHVCKPGVNGELMRAITELVPPRTAS